MASGPLDYVRELKPAYKLTSYCANARVIMSVKTKSVMGHATAYSILSLDCLTV